MASKSPRWSLGGLLGWKKDLPPAPRPVNKYHAVSILPGLSACAAAHRFAGKRMLSTQAPALPLPMCDASRCDCRYKHHKDRRAGPRRLSDAGLIPAGYGGSERRLARGRRADDL
jgi:hypothetical protein